MKKIIYHANNTDYRVVITEDELFAHTLRLRFERRELFFKIFGIKFYNYAKVHSITVQIVQGSNTNRFGIEQEAYEPDIHHFNTGEECQVWSMDNFNITEVINTEWEKVFASIALSNTINKFIKNELSL